MADYRKGQFTLEEVQAFALVDDTKRQLDCYRELGNTARPMQSGAGCWVRPSRRGRGSVPLSGLPRMKRPVGGGARPVRGQGLSLGYRTGGALALESWGARPARLKSRGMVLGRTASTGRRDQRPGAPSCGVD